MTRLKIKLALMSAALAATCCIPGAFAADAAKEPPRAVISIYHVAPGKQLEFLKWMATREAIAKQIGMPMQQVYAHVDGDSWDYLTVAAQSSDAQDKQMEEAMKKAGLTTGFRQSLEIRQFLASHTDTYAVGPVTAGELVAAAAK